MWKLYRRQWIDRIVCFIVLFTPTVVYSISYNDDRKYQANIRYDVIAVVFGGGGVGSE